MMEVVQVVYDIVTIIDEPPRGTGFNTNMLMHSVGYKHCPVVHIFLNGEQLNPPGDRTVTRRAVVNSLLYRQVMSKWILYVDPVGTIMKQLFCGKVHCEP